MPPYTDTHSHCCDAPSSSSSSSRPLHHRPSSRPLHHHPTKSRSNSSSETRDGLLQLAAMELEAMRRPPLSPQKRGSNGSVSSSGSSNSNNSTSSCSTTEETERSFPSACLHLLHTLPGNSRCHDCHTGSASWASVSYGITLCLQCSGKHRGLGVNCSFIKSLTLDSWKQREILCMLEGGNEQLNMFFDRHGMGGGNATTSVGVLDRYKTKAASFYRHHLKSHANQVAEGGLYEGREASRKSNTQRNKVNKAASGKLSKRKKSTEQQQLATVMEKESVEPACGVVGA
mmetsp:Transcript_29153/g.50346  ORF Transcript_29153/g.50346 Transcript_29153/m.50346 type:complete len:287 (-) Transcript_29153:694-1554(-)